MRLNKLLTALLLLCFAHIYSVELFAQVSLDRISNTARSDGKGYVLRYHLDAAIDSFEVIQPAPDFVQFILYKDNIDTTGIRIAEQSEVLNDIRLYDLGYGLGIDIYLSPNLSLKATSYLDQNKRDVLVPLTITDRTELQAYSRQFLARNWYRELVNTDSMLEHAEISEPVLPNDYNNTKDRLRFDKIVIDPGHGGHDPGTIGYKGVQEKQITLAVAKKLGAYINEYMPDVEVVYTRTDDTYLGLEKLGSFANLAEADLFVSIHCNAFHNPRVYGSEVYFLGLHRSDAAFEVMKRENSAFKNEIDKELTEEDLLVYELAHSGYIATSEKIAYMIDDQFKNRAQRKSRGVKQAGFQVLFEASMPAVLVELGFISNPGEQRFLTSDYGQTIMASALFRAIRDYKVDYEKKHAYNSTSN